MLKNIQLFVLTIVFIFTSNTLLAQSEQPNFDLVGFATENGNTTGGQTGSTVTANTFAQLKSYAESTTPYVIKVNGTIENGPEGGRISIASNKSIIGVGNDAFLNGIGLEVKNNNNVIIQNLKISLIGVTTRTDKSGVYSSTGDNGQPQILVNGGDCISINGNSTNIWIDHCEIFSEDPNTQTNKDLYDGLIDIKQNSGFITISWCYLHDHHKGGLVGASDSDLWADRKITMHHNYYNKVFLRVPMYRGSTGHFFNNYIVDAVDATEIRANTCVRVEKNYYEALHYAIYTPSDSPGQTERIDNIIVSQASRPFPNNCVASIPYDYASVLTNTTADVKTIVPQYAGVGKLGDDCNGDYLGSAYLDDCENCVGGNTGLDACVLDCNGDENGTASLDGCGICSGGTTGVEPCDDDCTWVEYQAEDGTMSSGSIDSNNEGFTGTGFVNTDNANGEWSEHTVNVTTAGIYNVRFRYANGSTDRPMSVNVNNVEQISSQSFPNSGSWTTWEFSSFTLNLIQGDNILRFIALSGSGAANLDRIDVCSAEGLFNPLLDLEGFVQIDKNPVGEEILIKFKELPKQHTTIQLYDSLGKLIINNHKVMSSEEKLNLQHLDAGLYFVKIASSGKTVVKRIMKK